MARNPNRGGNRTPARDYNKKYTDKDRPSGWYNVEGKGKRWWNSYSGKWTRSPIGSTDDMIRKAHSEGRIPTATNTGSPRSGTRSITKNKDKDKPGTPSGPKRQPGDTGGRGRGTNTYTVSGITYDSKTGRPVVVSKNRQPVKAQDNTKKDTTADDNGGRNNTPPRTPPRNNSTPTTPRRRGAGVETPLSGGAGGTRPTGPGPNEKPKSRLEKALSGIGKWEEPKEKPKRNKPTSRFLKKSNTRRKER